MSRWAVVSRAWATSALAVACALWAHTAAGGTVTSWLGPLLALALGSVLALPLMRARPSWLRTLGLLLPSQLAYHFLFGSMGAPSLPDAAGPLPAHTHHGALGTPGQSAGSMDGMPSGHQMGGHQMGGHEMTGPLADLASASPWGADQFMIVAHVGAAVASALLVRWGELLLIALCAQLRLGARAVASSAVASAQRVALILGTRAPRPAALRWAAGVDPHPHRPGSLRLVGSLRFRGPPSPA